MIGHSKRKKNPHIVLIGGGTGSFTLLNRLKNYTENITALVNMSDDGGSTGLLRDQLDVLPPGDVRQCLVALSESSDALRNLFNYRFPAGSDFAGHSFGNLFISAVEMSAGNFADAVKLAGEVLNIRGQVVPVTLDDCRLVMETIGGRRVEGQYATRVFSMPSLKGATIAYEHPVKLNQEAAAAIQKADLIVIAPGDLYASLAPTLLVEGMQVALQRTRAKIAYVCNLVNKAVHTVDYGVEDYTQEVERFMGFSGLTHVLYNVDMPRPEMLAAYALEDEYPVRVNPRALKNLHYKAISGHFLLSTPPARNKNDTLIRRSLIRHDAEPVCRALMKLV